MNVRPLLLAALALGLAAGCSKPTASSSAPPPSEPGTAPAPSEARPAEAAPPPGEPGTAPAAAPAPTGPATDDGSGAKAGASTVYIVRNSGVRCITTPCPYFQATPVDKPDSDAIQVHELDLSAVAGGSDERQQELLRQTELAEGLRLEGTLETQPNAGPAGAATILRAKRVDG